MNAAAKAAAERPLPPVPEVLKVEASSESKIPSLLKKSKHSNIVAKWFAEKKAVRQTRIIFPVLVSQYK